MAPVVQRIARLYPASRVLTDNQSLRIVYANSWHGNVCMEYLSSGARELGETRYAVLEKDSNLVNYDLDHETLRRDAA